MTDETVTPLTGRLVTIGTCAAENVARSLDLPESAVETIERAMADEVAAMSTHFVFTIEDMRKQWEKAVADVLSWRVIALGAGVGGVVLGWIGRSFV
jgi:hypothetical protein